MLTDPTTRGIREVLEGRRTGARSMLLFAGPAVIASIAYMDPGNFATNIQAGARYGYTLLWVVLAANLIAMLFQGLSAKLGIVTNRNLAEMCREQFPKPAVLAMWVVSEIAAMATDLAEFLGGAIGLALLFDMPLMAGMAVTAVITYGILMLERSGLPADGDRDRRVGRDHRALLPDRDDHRAGRLGRGGAPSGHAAHSGCRGADHRGRHHRRHRDAACRLSALRPDSGARAGAQRSRAAHAAAVLQPRGRDRAAVAGMVNMAMVMMASAAFHLGHSDVAEIETAYHT